MSSFPTAKLSFCYSAAKIQKTLKHAIPKNGDAKVYRFLGIASFFKTPYLCTRNQKSAVMLATPEWIVLYSYYI